MATRRGDTLIFPKPPVIAAHACIGGKKEGESPLAAEFDELHSDNRLGQASWEAAETQLQLQTARLCLKKAHATEKDVSLLLAGDLQAQCTASGYAARALGLPFAGLFGACSTMAEALGVGACLCSAGMADGLLAMTSSHFCTAERQFRTPLSYGAVRTPTAQWTATAAGACLLRPAGQGVGIRAVTFGRVQDLGIRDINNMGAAMAPAAAATLLRYLTDTNTQPQEFDAICTGDLGHVGSQLFRELLAAEGLLLGTMWTAVPSSMMPRASRCTAALLGRGAVQQCSAGISCPAGAAGAAPGSLSGHGRADEPDHLFAEGEHPRHLAPGGACCPGGTERREHMNYFWAFVTGGAICVVGQLFLDLTALTPARILTGYVVAGVVLSALGWYAPLAEFAGCGATVPLLGFGHLLAKGVRTALAEEGAIGILTGGLTAAAAGITTSLVCGVVCSLVGRSHDQN